MGEWVDYDLIPRSFNCTFMELKYKKPKRYEEMAERFNCTFMELKCTSSQSAEARLYALIVPLWN